MEEINRYSSEFAPGRVNFDWFDGDVGKAYEKDGLFGGAAKLAEFAGESTSSMLGGMLPQIAAGTAVAGTGAAVGLAGVPVAALGIAGFGAASFLQYLGTNIQRQKEEGAFDTDDVELDKLLGATGGQTLMDTALAVVTLLTGGAASGPIAVA